MDLYHEARQKAQKLMTRIQNIRDTRKATEMKAEGRRPGLARGQESSNQSWDPWDITN